MIKHAIFDVGEVLVNGFFGAEKHIQQVTGTWVSNRRLQTEELRDHFFKGQISEDELWQRMKKRFRWTCEIDLLKRAVRKNFTQVPGTRDIVVELRMRGTCRSINLLSNHGKEWVDHIQKQHPFHELFDVRHYSCNTGIPKPESQAFMLIAHEIGANPDECLFIDDYNLNITAARQLGFATHLFTNARKLRSELRILGLLS